MRPSVYQRPNKPRTMARPRRLDEHEGPIIERPIHEPLVLSKGSECYVTPPDVADLMADYAQVNGRCVLEPSAGTGNLVRAVQECGASGVVAVEREGALVGHLRNNFDGIDIVRGCFLEWAAATGKRFDRVVMNPPFRPCKAHVEAARALIDSNGLLVALLPVTFKGGEELERLPDDTFPGIRVNTKLVVFEG